MDFEILETEEVYHGRKIVVERRLVRYSSGREQDYGMVHHPGAVTIVPVDQEGWIWLIDQYRLVIGKMILELPAGTLEHNETPEVCALREMREEIGFAADSLKKIGEFYSSPGYSDEYLHVFLATGLREDPLELDVGEFIQVKKYPAEDVYQMVAQGKIRDGKTLAALALARPFILSA
jgi:ADP-ribose pyrophosphatase